MAAQLVSSQDSSRSRRNWAGLKMDRDWSAQALIPFIPRLLVLLGLLVCCARAEADLSCPDYVARHGMSRVDDIMT